MVISYVVETCSSVLC